MQVLRLLRQFDSEAFARWVIRWRWPVTKGEDQMTNEKLPGKYDVREELVIHAPASMARLQQRLDAIRNGFEKKAPPRLSRSCIARRASSPTSWRATQVWAWGMRRLRSGCRTRTATWSTPRICSPGDR